MTLGLNVALVNLESLLKNSQCSLRDFSVKNDGRLVASPGLFSRAWANLTSVFSPERMGQRVDTVRNVFRANLDSLKLNLKSHEQVMQYSFLKRKVAHLLAYSEGGVIPELRKDLEEMDLSYRDSEVKAAFDNLSTVAKCSHLLPRNLFVNDRGRLVATTTLLGRAWNVLEEHVFKRCDVKKHNARVSQLVMKNLITLQYQARSLSTAQVIELAWNLRKIECFLRDGTIKHNPVIKHLLHVFKDFHNQADEGWVPLKGRVTNFEEEIELKVTPANPVKAVLAGKKPGETHLYRTPNAGHGNRGFEAMCIFFSTQGKRLLRALTGGFFFKYFSRDETQKEIYAQDRLPSHSFNGGMELEMIGHATVLIKINKNGQHFNLLCDPAFHDLNPLFYPRKTDPACSISELPRIDAVFITHDHHDHCDDTSLNELLRFQPTMLVPAGNRSLFEKKGFKHVIEMGWGEEVTFSTGG